MYYLFKFISARCINIHFNLIHLFFITFLINIFITLYFIYSIFEKLFFLNTVGAKLKIKKEEKFEK